MVLIQSEPNHLGSQIHVVQVRQRQQVLAEVRLGEPDARTEAPEPLHMPGLDRGQRRRHSTKNSYYQATQYREERAVLALDDHCDAARKTVNPPEIEQIRRIHFRKTYQRRCENREEDGEVQAAEPNSRQCGQDLRGVVGASRMPRSSLTPVNHLLFAEDPEARGRSSKTDGHTIVEVSTVSQTLHWLAV